MLNLFVTDSERAVVLPGVAADTDAPYRGVAERLMLEQQGQGSRQRSVTAQVADTNVRAARGSVLVLGGPGQNRAADWAVGGCGNRVKLGADAFTVEGRFLRCDLGVCVNFCHGILQKSGFQKSTFSRSLDTHTGRAGHPNPGVGAGKRHLTC